VDKKNGIPHLMKMPITASMDGQKTIKAVIAVRDR